MPLQTNLNVSPYYADYTPDSDYYKILFKAGYPVQARELSNLQLMMQNQMEVFLSRILKEGDNLVPGEFTYQNPSPYVRVSSITQGSTSEEFIGSTLTGAVSGVKAVVVYAVPATIDDDLTFYVSYVDSGTSTTDSTFLEGETLESDTANRYTATVGVSGVSKPVTTPAMGQGSVFTITEGYYFIDGTAVRNTSQTITLDKYGTTPSYAVGFVVGEEFINSSEDPLLLDNSQGSSNFAAPGADRLKITLTLSKRLPETSSPNFIQLANIVQGSLQGKPDQTVKWDWLYDILAKRTFDESGDYIVSEFAIDFMEYANTSSTDGLFDPDENDTFPPVPGSGSTERMSYAEAQNYFVVKVSPGLAYVQGYEVGYSNPVYLYATKPRDLDYRQNVITTITEGMNIGITNMSSFPDVMSLKGAVNTLGMEGLTMYSGFNNGYVGSASAANVTTTEGVVIPFNYGKIPPEVTYHVTTIGEITGTIANGEQEQIYKGFNSAVVTSTVALKRGDTFYGSTIVSVTEVRRTPIGVMYPRYVYPQQVLQEGASGLGGFNSVFDVGITTSQFFSEFALVEDDDSVNFNVDWVIGDLVVGATTAAMGVVESGSTKDVLLLSNIIGEFEAGEDITQGNKVSRIANVGEVFGLQFSDAGTGGSTFGLGSETTIKVTSVGSELTLTKGTDYTFVTSTNTLELTGAGREKLLDFPFERGSRYNQRVNYDLVTAPGGVKGYGITVAGKYNNSIAKVKSLYSPLQATDTDFAADVSFQSTVNSEVVPVADNSLFTGTKGSNYIDCDNFSGDPSEQLEYEDLVTFVDDTGATISKLVYFTSKPIGYGELRSQSRIYFTTTLEEPVSGKTVQRIRVKSNGLPSESLYYQLPQNAIQTLQNTPEATRIEYTVLQEFITTTTALSNSVTISSSKQNEQIINNINQTTVTIVDVANDPTNEKGLRGRNPIIGTSTLSADNRTITYNFVSAFPENVTLKILVPVFVTNAKAKAKTFVQNETKIIPVELATKQILSIGVADVYEVTNVTMGADETDIMGYFSFDNGQRDNYYGISTLTRLLGSPDPSDYVTITYSYFKHEGDGDFFSVDSYTGTDGVGYDAIPFYDPIATPIKGAERSASTLINLRDVVDFRPIVNTDILTDANIGDSYLPFLESGGDTTNSRNFADSIYNGNGQTPRIPISGTTFKCDMSYYLAKTYALFLGSNGDLSLNAGASSSQPFAAPPVSVGMRLYNIPMPAYTYALSQVKARKFNYKRYRMKDIAALDKRLSRVERLVSLSILEQSALNMEVRDAVTGLNRFKNGIVVTGFNNHELGATSGTQYRNSIDPSRGILRPPCYINHSTLLEANQTPAQRIGNGYRRTGSVVTLDYNSDLFIEQPFATRFINLQPYVVFTFEGNMTLFPSIDTFQETNRIPDLVVEDNSLFDAMTNLTEIINDESDWFETVWGEWRTVGGSSSGPQVIATNVGDAGATRQEATDMFWNARNQNGSLTNVDPRALTIFRDNNRRPNANVPLVTVTQTVSSSTEERIQTQDFINVTGQTVETSYGDRVIDVQLARTMRSTVVEVNANRLKPNTRFYFFFDGVDVTSWFCPDNPTPASAFPDGLSRFVDAPNSNPKGFGMPIVSDDIGQVRGIFLVPEGRAPVQGSFFNGSMETIQYQTSGATRSFNTGQKKVRLTSSPTDATDPQILEAVAEAVFTSQGVIVDKQETVVSTRQADVAIDNREVGRESITTTSVSTEIEAVYTDPVCQTFYLDDNNVSGVYLTELEVYFRTKDKTEFVEAYLSPTEGHVPTDTIIPFSRISKDPDTILRVQCTNLAGMSFITLAAGTQVVGQTSGATGVLKSDVTFSSSGVNPVTNVDNTTYNVILDNYLNDFEEGEVIVPTLVPATNATFQIVTDAYKVDHVSMTALGKNYTNPTVTFSAPQLKGGVTATGTVKFRGTGTTEAAGRVYEIVVTNPGSGYTQVPGVTISDPTGTGATAECVVLLNTPAVRMGVATSEDATAPTKFKFPSPVYLLGDTNYGFVLRSPNSVNYTVFTSKLGENAIGTENRVTEQASLGALFKSQNGGLWTEDQTEDIKFKLNRAVYNTSTEAIVDLQDGPVPNRRAVDNPVETSIRGNDDTSTVFEENPKIVRFFCFKHGNVKGDLVAISGVVGNPGGIPNADYNTLHEVIDSHFNWFTVEMPTAATSAVRAGGEDAYCTVNIPYEVLDIQMGAISLPAANFNAQVRTTQVEAVTGFNRLNKYTRDNPNYIIPAQSYYYNGPKVVANRINEAYYNEPLKLRGQKSLLAEFNLNSANDKISPFIDLERVGAICVRNLIDNPSPTDDVYGMQTATVTFSSNLTDGTAAASTLAGLTFSDKEILEGSAGRVVASEYNSTTRRLKVQGRNVGNLKVGSTFTKTGMGTLAVSQVTTTNGRLFIPETNSRGSTYSKWVSRLLLFEDICDGLEVKLSCLFWDKESVKMYFRARKVGFEGNLDLEPWVAFNGTGVPDNYEKISPSEDATVDPSFVEPSSWQDLTWSIQDLTDFDAVQVKIVMAVDNPAYSPLIDDMQLVASE